MDLKEAEGMQIQYALLNNKIVILSCRGSYREVKLPKEMDGYLVEEIGAYAFSNPKEGILGEWLDSSKAGNSSKAGMEVYTKIIREEFVPGSSYMDLWGKNIKEITLPKGIKRIGKYAFYNCTALTDLTLYGGKIQIENGAFMNCDKLSHIHVIAEPEEATCLRELLSEIQREVVVFFEGRQGGAQVIFPEYYEESVENTPARVFHYLLHGAGYRYRQCFDKDVLKLVDYDLVFLTPEIQTEEETALLIALKRLLFPYGLGRKAKERYLNYIKNNQERAINRLIKERDVKTLSFLLELDIVEEKTFEVGLKTAAKLKQADCQRILIEMRYRRFPPKEKKFEL